MTPRQQQTAHVTVRMAIKKTGLSRRQINACVSRSLVAAPLSSLDLQELRRIRRLRELGVNWAGIEIILRMRSRMEQLHVELERRDESRARSVDARSAEIWQRLLVWKPE
jgi:DNA-binding transcriptional MerR regulator